MYVNMKNMSRILVITAIMLLLTVSYSIGESTETVRKNHLDDGDLVKLGTYNGESIVWRYMGEDEIGSYLISDKILTFAEGGNEESNQRIADYTTINNFKYEDYNSAYYVLSNEKIFLPSMEEIYKFFIEKDKNLGANPTQMAYELDESKVNNKILFEENHSYWLRTPKTKDILSGIETGVYTIYPYFINSDNPIDIFTEEPRIAVNEMVYKRNRNPYQRHAVGVRPACYLEENLLYIQDEEGYWIPQNYTEKQ